MKYNSRFRFRIWSLQRNRWENLVYFTLYFLPSYEQNDIIVQQCTGLKDIKGVDIYEGDIIRGLFDFGPAGFVEKTLPVKWHDTDGYQWQYWDLTTIQVVGNIFENKELLT